MDLRSVERFYYMRHLSYIAGVDEVGRGCLAGPVYAAAVILPKKYRLPGLNDSKKLTPLQRERLFKMIVDQAVCYQVTWVDVEEIDRLNIFHASMKAMALALESLSQVPEMVLVDGKFRVPHVLPQHPLVKGDSRSATIAAASILAKVSRDRRACDWEQEYPAFNFSKHKGYGTAQHMRELKENGPTPLHRRSFAPVQALLKNVG